MNERFWSTVDSIRLKGSTFAECYREVADGLSLPGPYWDDLRRAMRVWTELFG